MKNYVLRDYQQKAVDKSVAFLRNSSKDNGLVILPTAAGKSIVIANIAKELNVPLLNLAPTKEILEQNYEKYTSYGFDAGIYSASVGRKDIQDVTFATIGSVINKPELFKHIKNVIVDECFRGDVEILTNCGFVKFEDLTKDKLVAQWDYTGEISFVAPLNHIKRNHIGELTLFKLKYGIEVPMTSNHEQIFLYKKTGFKKQKIGDIKFTGEKSIPVSGLSNLILDDALTDLERLYIAAQADGSVHDRYETYTTYSFTFARPRKIERFLSLCDRCGVIPKEVKKSHLNKRRWLVKIPGKITKNIQDHITFPMSAKKAQDILEEMVEWDGSKLVGGKQFYFSSVCKSVADFYNAVATIAGHSCYMSVQKDNRKESYKDVHRLFISLNKKFRSCFSMKISKISFSGDVYCVTVPSGCIVVRYKGYTFITGNCHSVSAKESMYSTFLNGLGVRVLGFTGTPFRLSTDGYGGSMLKFLTRTRPRIFNKVVHCTQTGELFDKGYLAKLKYLSIPGFDRAKIKLNSTGADFDEESLQRYLNNINFPDQVVKVTKKLLDVGRKRVLIFTRFINEAQFVTSQIPGVEIVTGKTPKKERARIINGLRDGTIPGVANVGVMTTGVDIPELDAVVGARPTLSLALYYQMIGRGMRIHPNKEFCMIVDMCENIPLFGHIEDLVIADEGNEKWVVTSKGKKLTNVYYGT